jgi:hypothetical protein
MKMSHSTPTIDAYDESGDTTLYIKNSETAVGTYVAHVNIEGDLTVGGTTSLSGYVKTDGSTPMTANWAFGAFDLTGMSKVTVDNIELDGQTILSTSGGLTVGTNVSAQTVTLNSASDGTIVLNRTGNNLQIDGNGLTIDVPTGDQIIFEINNSEQAHFELNKLVLDGTNEIEKLAATLSIDVNNAAASTLYIVNQGAGATANLDVSGDLTVGGTVSGTIDADTLDTKDSTDFLLVDGTDQMDGNLNMNGNTVTNCLEVINASGLVSVDGSTGVQLQYGGTNKVVVLQNDINIAVPIDLYTTSSDPGSPSESWIYYNSASDRIKLYTASGWKTIPISTDSMTPSSHSQTHEDGYADEINIGGLSGEPAALTTHMADTTTHGATGAIVGTTNSQTLSDKIIDTSCTLQGECARDQGTTVSAVSPTSGPGTTGDWSDEGHYHNCTQKGCSNYAAFDGKEILLEAISVLTDKVLELEEKLRSAGIGL